MLDRLIHIEKRLIQIGGYRTAMPHHGTEEGQRERSLQIRLNTLYERMSLQQGMSKRLLGESKQDELPADPPSRVESFGELVEMGSVCAGS